MNRLDRINKLEVIVKEMKQITNTVEYRKNRGFPKDGGLEIELAKRKRDALKILDTFKYKV